MDSFLQQHKYIDFSSPNIQAKAAELFGGLSDDIKKAKTAYEFIRDEILHSFDVKSGFITAKASDVLKYKTGICHAKANLLAALLRSQGIPTGFCFQRLTLADDDSMGYAVHCTYTNVISAEDCNKLRNSTGWTHMHIDQIEAGLSGIAKATSFSFPAARLTSIKLYSAKAKK